MPLQKAPKYASGAASTSSLVRAGGVSVHAAARAALGVRFWRPHLQLFTASGSSGADPRHSVLNLPKKSQKDAAREKN